MKRIRAGIRNIPDPSRRRWIASGVRRAKSLTAPADGFTAAGGFLLGLAGESRRLRFGFREGTASLEHLLNRRRNIFSVNSAIRLEVDL